MFNAAGNVKQYQLKCWGIYCMELY